ncbi:cholesterol transport system auxiliary component [Methylohalomonas lacus]|uniref:Cholesterol transport system auxiliary component n=1 Tax=Methylohalomonas lacus TaxID=398773 RepID=A0AAE3L5B0_9GAMM|nr:ABC-type transport auxiliary lipoprotein family protein [Methylohalomonas lacus]MCS3903027.1 cholesterol transport system auxiliary component [Methylohalomonas lacus]
MKKAALALLIGLVGCAAPSPAPEDHFYRLPAADAGHCNGQLTADTLRVAAFRTDGLLHERGIVYSDSNDSVELKKHDYHLWQQAPADLVRDHLLNYLRDCQTAATVTRAADVPAEFVIAGYLGEFMQFGKAGPEYVVVTLELQLRHGAQARPLLVKTYSEREPVSDAAMPALVNAFGRALERVYERFLADARPVASERLRQE